MGRPKGSKNKPKTGIKSKAVKKRAEIKQLPPSLTKPDLPKKRGRPSKADIAAREAALQEFNAKRLAIDPSAPQYVVRQPEPVKKPKVVIEEPPTPPIIVPKVFVPGTRVMTAPKCVVGGIVRYGKVIYQNPNSAFAVVLWDDKNSDSRHVTAIVESDE